MKPDGRYFVKNDKRETIGTVGTRNGSIWEAQVRVERASAKLQFFIDNPGARGFIGPSPIEDTTSPVQGSNEMSSEVPDGEQQP